MQNGILYGSSTARESNSNITVCEWSNFLQFIETNCIPAFIFWGNTNCQECEKYNNSIIKSSAFADYMSGDGNAFAYYSAKGATLDSAVKDFTESQYGEYPYVRLYWEKSDGSVVSKDISRGSPTYAETNPDTLIADISQTFTDYQPLSKVTLSYSANGGTGTVPDSQTVSNGSSITLSLTRLTKTGYTHIGWQIWDAVYTLGATYVVTANVTAVAVWQKKDIDQDTPVDKNKDYSTPIFDPSKESIPDTGCVVKLSSENFPFRHSYDTYGKKYIRISDNLSSLCIRGSTESGIQNQMVAAYINRKIPEIAPSCFMNCSELTAINADNSIAVVGDYAFYGCSSLKGINILGTANKQLKRIGEYAFAKSGLESVKINHLGTVDDSAIHTGCFASCDNLERVEFTNSTYLGAHMFDGCKKLSQITLNNYHSYVSEYCFANCKSLASISLPSKIYMLSPYMFSGCTNLTAVKFADNADLRQCGDAAFADCPKLTSITLPASVSSLSFIDSNFLSGSSISRVEFKGIPDEYLTTVTKVSKEIKYQTGQIYSTDSEFRNIKSCALKNNIPMVFWVSSNSGCSHCKAFKKNVIKPLKDWFGTTPYLYIECLCGENNSMTADLNNLEKFVTNAGMNFSYGVLPYLYMYWKKEDGTVKKWGKCGGVEHLEPEWVKNKILSLFSGYEGGTEIEYEINEKITTFGRGEGLSVTYVSKTGQEYLCGNDSVEYVPETKVDRETTDNFKYGIWYYNARELKEFADEHNQPVLFEYSSSACDPCRDFRKSTFMNDAFQTEIRERPCLFCRVEIGEGEYFDHPTGTQAYYLSHDLNKENTYIPCLIYYWKKSDTETVQTAWNYNYRTDPANANYETVLSKLDAMLGGYEGEYEFWPPTVYWSENQKFQYYQNETDDETGRYFICDTKQPISKYEGTLEIDLDINSGITAYWTVDQSSGSQTGQNGSVLSGIELGETVSIPDYTYQYYTTQLSDAQYNSEGIIFKVESGVVQYINKFTNASEDVGNTESLQYQKGNLYSVGSATGFNQILSECRSNSIPLVILESGSSTTEFDTEVKDNSSFKNWLKQSDYVMIEVRTDDWSNTVGKAVRQFETETSFHGNTVSDPLPKLLVYHGCSSCTADGRIVIYCRRKITIESGKDYKYYTGLLESYAKESENE